MIALLTLLGAAAIAVEDPSRLPPEPPPSIRDLPRAEPAPAIFLYSVDDQCRIGRIRKLQGPEQVSWRDVQRTKQLFREQTTWRFVDGERLQLRERRVKLLGEMVLEGMLVCHVLPSGDVVEAWIERQHSGVGRRRAPDREPVQTAEGDLVELGMFSVELAAGAGS